MRARVGARVAAAAPAMMGESLCCTHCPIQSTRARLSRPTSGYPHAAATAAVAVVVAAAAALVARSEASWLAAAALRAPLLTLRGQTWCRFTLSRAGGGALPADTGEQKKKRRRRERRGRGTSSERVTLLRIDVLVSSVSRTTLPNGTRWFITTRNLSGVTSPLACLYCLSPNTTLGQDRA